MSDSSTHTGGRAVFLSYAREDTNAARRIAEALRGFGIEVWFDQNELRGGDQWDARIRSQIKSCTLFIPIISATTQARDEAYFRLEWKLADDRSQLMAPGKPFIVPVVIDATSETGAIVPDSFARAQWTQLSDGNPSTGFIEQVKHLLEVPKKPALKPDQPRPPTLPPHFREAAQARAATAVVPKKSLSPAVAFGALAVVAISAAAVFMATRKPALSPAVAAVVPAAPVPAPKPVRLADKSVAVLPFTNMSEEKDNAFFADGVHEDVLTNLALIRELRVVSRTSVQSYRGTNKPMKQIAEELGVTYILEGSVRRVGNKVRVTGQLIHAATDEHVWAQSYDRDLTDIFTIQAELSRQIAGALKAALSPEEKILIARRPTTNALAYDKFLQARDTINREGNITPARVRQIALLQEAVELDPTFAQAWGDLAAARAFWYFSGLEGRDNQLALAKAAIERAMQLAPDDPAVFGALGTYYYYGFRDYPRAVEQYERRAQLQPNSPAVFNSLALIQRRQGNWAQSLANSRRATELDPANLSYLRNLLATLRAGRRWDEAKDVQRRIVALLPDSLREAYLLAALEFSATGSTREMEAGFAKLSPDQRNTPMAIEALKGWASTIGDYAEAVRLDRLQPYYDGFGAPRHEQAYGAAYNLFAMGNTAAARLRLENHPADLRAQLQREPTNARVWSVLGAMEVILGNKEEAMRCDARAMELLPESRDALDGAANAAYRAFDLDWLGEKEEALAEYSRLLRVPIVGGMNVHELKCRHSTLRGEPRFEALLNDPKNNAPLF
jgi:TolB-like protein/Tfp pilus assembly protein PilF